MSADLQKLIASMQNSVNNLGPVNFSTAGYGLNGLSLPTPTSNLGWLAQAYNSAPTVSPQQAQINFNGASASQPTAPNATHQGLLGFLGNVWNHTGGDLYNHVSGALNGWLNGPDATEGDPFAALWGDLKSAGAGWNNPDQARQTGAQQQAQLDAQTPNGALRFVGDFLNNSARSPISYIPGGVIAKPVGYLADATGVSPALKYLTDLARGSVKTDVAQDAGKVAEGADPFAQATTKPPTMEPAPDINDWAFGEGNHYQEVPPQTITRTVPTTLANFAKPGTYMTQQTSANNLLNTLFNLGKDAGLPAGREAETLQDMLGSISGKTGTSLDSLINQASTLQDVSKNVNLANWMKTAGIGAEDIAPQIFKDGEKTVTDTIPTATNDPMTWLPPQEEGLVPVSDVRTNTETPFGAAPKLAEDATANALEQGATKGPYAKYAWQSKIGAPMAQALQDLVGPNGIPVANKVINGVTRAFTTLPGTTQAFKNLFSQFFGEKASGAHALNNWLGELFSGMNKAEREEFWNELEMTPVGQTMQNEKWDAIREKLEPVMEKALQTGQQRGFIKDAINPEDFGVKRYLPHVVVKDGTKLKAGDETGLFLRKSVDANNDRTLSGSIADLNKKHFASNGESPLFESDPIKSLGTYLHQLNDATTADNFITKAMANGSRNMSDIHPETGTPTVPYSYGGKTVMLPKDEAKILSGLGQKADEGLGSKIYRGAVNKLNQMMFLSSPFTHIINNLGFQTVMHDPGAFKDVIKNLPEAMGKITPGSDMDKALKAGALNLSSVLGGKGNVTKQLEQVAKQVDNKGGKLGKAFNFYKNMTPNVEKAYRTAIYTRAVQHGMSSEDAAKFVRSIFGGHIAPDTMSKAERALVGWVPFGNWTKTALTSNAKNAVKNPQLYASMFQGANTLNQEATGHGLLGNSNPAAIGIPGWKDAQGHQKYFEPYFPAWDLAKLAGQTAQQGLFRGPLNFLFNRQNPLAKGVEEDLTSEQNPFASPLNKFGIMPKATEALGPFAPANQQGMFFGGKGPKIPVASNPYVAPFVQGFTFPGLQTGYDALTGNGNLGNDINHLFTSGYVSSPNPASIAKQEKYLQSQMKSALKKQAQAQAKKG